MRISMGGLVTYVSDIPYLAVVGLAGSRHLADHSRNPAAAEESAGSHHSPAVVEARRSRRCMMAAVMGRYMVYSCVVSA
jgi:hypothetical protein